MKAVIIAHGFYSKEALKREVEDANLVICSDGGSIYAYKEGIVPDLIVGDFDSISKEVYNHFKLLGTEFYEFPKDKDYTDTELCIDCAIDRGAKIITIVSGLGSRIDHSLINIGLLYKILKSKLKGYIATDDAYIYLCDDKIKLEGKKGDTLSLIPLTMEVNGIVTAGLKYPLDNGSISIGQSIGVSNEFLSKECSIQVKEGILIIVKQNKI